LFREYNAFATHFVSIVSFVLNCDLSDLLTFVFVLLNLFDLHFTFKTLQPLLIEKFSHLGSGDYTATTGPAF